MASSRPLTDEIFTAFLQCRYKAHLKLQGVVGEKSDYERAQASLAAEYRTLAMDALLGRHEGEAVIENPLSLPAAIRSEADMIFGVTADVAGESCHLDALERAAPATAYAPVLFIRREKLTAEDRLLLAFGASILARIQETPPLFGRIVHGKALKHSRVELKTLSAVALDTVAQVHALNEAAKAPPLLLNRHCAECEFRRRCRAAATEEDNLSLLGGLSPKEIAGLHAKGIFTVTQYSYTFRPGRMKRRAETASTKHDQSLQALAIREKTVYVAQRPQLPDGNVRVYLDVEGLPEEDYYYLVGVIIAENTCQHRLSFWADSEMEEASMWTSFLQAISGLGENFVLFHYGSYESKFLDRMESRHGGDLGLIAKIRARSVNVLSLIYSRVYFPTYGNDLKSVAGCLGYYWSFPEASGLQAIAWRYAWRATRDESFKQLLIAYNLDDCSALEVVVAAIRALDEEAVRADRLLGPPVAGVEEIEASEQRKYGQTRFALPEFSAITKRAYFDYQRDKVLCRTSRAVKASVRRKKQPRPSHYRVNQEVECQVSVVCPYCGSTVLDQSSRYQRLVIDLKSFRGGMKRWVTRYKVIRRRCRKCWRTFLPDDYRALPSKYGWTLRRWVTYSSISLRETNDAVVESLADQFGIHLASGLVSKIKREVVALYRATYESLLADLRNGPLVHVDETKVKIKGTSGDGYVWVFASPKTAVYVYSPTRDGDIARDTLVGFKGVLVSDFFAAYDSLDCPQQKCLIHLIRDLNDDILKHPFDEELKQQAARFAGLLQVVVETIDRYGLKKYHLHKHRKDVDRYFEAESGASYQSEPARHYQRRMLKYRGKLFTFLDYDGVPWNNNNAENAVKGFVSRRKTLGMPFSEAGIREYLLLLSICQTLRYRSISFWQFLHSGETDIEAFTARHR